MIILPRASARLLAALAHGLLLILVLCRMAGAAEALPATTLQALDALGAADAQQREEALTVLAEHGDARLLPALDAFYKGMLARQDGHLVIYGGKTAKPGGGAGYPLLDALTQVPLRDAAGAARFQDGLPADALKARTAERRRLKGMMAALSLRHPDPARRRAAIISVADDADSEVVPELQAQLAQDPHGANARLLREALARIDLAKADGAALLAAIATLGELHAGRALPALLDRRNREERRTQAHTDEGKLLAALAGLDAEALAHRWDAADAHQREALAALGLPAADPAAVAAKLGERVAALAAAAGAAAPLHAALDTAIAGIEARQSVARGVAALFAGLSQGSILIIMALGLSIIFGLMGVINMAHGELMMIGAFTTWLVSKGCAAWCPSLFDYYLVLAIPAAFAVSAAVGWLIEWSVIRHLYGRPLETLLATWGISLILIQIVRVLFGDSLSTTQPKWMDGGWAVSEDIVLPANRLFIIAFSLSCILLMYAITNWTKLGLLLRATTQNRRMAACLGVPVRRIDGLTFALGAGLAGLAGAAVPMFDKINPSMGQSYIVDSFMVVVTGGVGKLAGVVWSGLGLGVANKLIEPWLQAVFTKVAILGLIIVFLQWRPSGLFPAKGRLADA